MGNTEDKNAHIYRQIFNAVSDAIIVYDVETGGILHVNQAALEMYGYTHEEMLDLCIGDLSAREVPYTHRRTIRDTERAIQAWQAKKKSGVFFWVEVVLKKVDIDDQGRILAVVRDITERRQAEKDLQINIAFLRTLIETIPCLVWLKDPDGAYLACNLKFERFFGAKEAEIIGKTDYDFVDKELADFFREKDQAAMATGTPTMNEEEVTYADDGHKELLETIKTPMYDAEGRLIGVLGIGYDITDRKRVEEAMEQRIVALTQPMDDSSHVTFEELFNLDDIQRLQDEFAKATGVASMIIRADGTPLTKPSNFCYLCKDIIRKNEKGAANCRKSDIAIGCIKKDAKGPVILPCLSGGLWDAGASIFVGNKHIASWLVGQVRNEAQSEEQMSRYAREIGADVDEFLEAFRQVPAMDRQRFECIAQVLFTLANQLSTMAYQNMQQARFITDGKRAEVEREALIKNLEFKNKEMQDVIYAASHDLRSPLVNIEGFSCELQADCERLVELLEVRSEGLDDMEPIQRLLHEGIPQSLGFIAGSTKKMVNLLDGLLQVSRVGTARINTVRLDMDKTIQDLLISMEHQINENKVAITVEPLPDCVGDLDMADRIFSNLLGNAIKYLDPERVGEIRVSGKVEKNMSIYCIADNGIGIDQSHQGKVFEIFHRLNPRGPTTGEGLGLTIVKRMLDRLNGTIRLESEAGKGSQFIVSLPAAKG